MFPGIRFLLGVGQVTSQSSVTLMYTNSEDGGGIGAGISEV